MQDKVKDTPTLDHRISQGDNIDTLLAANPDLENILGVVIRDVFYASFERAFGNPTSAVRERVDGANPAEIAEWIPNLVSAGKIEDVFVSGLERVLALHVASIMTKRFGVDVSSARSLTDLVEVCEQLKIKPEETSAD